VVLGIPGIPYQFLTEHYFWREAAAEIKQIAAEVRHETGKEPIVAGMSKWSVASALYFYTHDDAKLDIRSRNMFGDSGAMYEFWFPSQAPANRPVIQVGMKRGHLDETRTGINVITMLDQPGTIASRVIERYGTPVRRLYYRVSQGFKGTGLSATQ
jgi:dolichol-phosphate mannosyltransferase